MGKHYTPQEDAIIMDNYPNIGIDVMKLLPDRDAKSIMHRANQLGCYRQRRNKVEAWSDKEIEVLRNNFTSMGTSIVCLLPNRSLYAIRNKAQMMGILPHGRHTGGTKPNDWSRAEDRIIIKTCYDYIENKLKYDDKLLNLLPDRRESDIRLRVANLSKYRNGICGGYPINVYIATTGSYKGYESIGMAFDDLVEVTLTAIKTNSNKPEVAEYIVRALDLHYKFGMDIIDISEELNVSEDTAKWLLNAGTRFLKQALKKNH